MASADEHAGSKTAAQIIVELQQNEIPVYAAGLARNEINQQEPLPEAQSCGDLDRKMRTPQ